MTTSPQLPPRKPGQINIVLKLILLIMVAVPAVICCIFLFGKLWGLVALVAYSILMPPLIWLLRRRRKTTEADTLRRIDEAMGKSSDDPRQMARFMR